MAHRFADESVDDSEPEREAIRRRVSAKRALKESRTTRLPANGMIHVIELTDDESDKGVAPSKLSIINISDDILPSCLVREDSNTRSRAISPKRTPPFLPHPQRLPSNGSPHSIGSDSGIQSGSVHAQRSPMREPAIAREPNNHLTPDTFGIPIIDNSISIGEDSREDDEPFLSLKRFAYADTRPTSIPLGRPTAGPSRQCSTPRIESADKLPSKPSNRGATHALVASFSDADLTRLMKCVCCEARWTTRKTIAQKLIHVKACAKKKSFNDETVRLLIRKEIENSPVSEGASKGKGKAPLVPAKDPPAPKTFFEDVVHDAAPKAKGRRKLTTETVQNAFATRDVILGRARALLGAQSLDQSAGFDEDFSVHTQTMGPSKLGSTAPPPATQQYGQSYLASKLGKAKPLFTMTDGSDHSDDDAAAMSLATQTFAPSRLGSAVRRTSRTEAWDMESNQLELGDANSSILSPSNASNRLLWSTSQTPPTKLRPVFFVDDSSAREHFPRTPTMRRPTGSRERPLSESPKGSMEPMSDTGRFPNDSLEDNYFCNNDDAILHFVPALEMLEPGIAAQHISYPVSSVKSPSRKKARKTDTLTSGSEGSDAPLMNRMTPRKVRGKSKPKGKLDLDAEFDEDWENRFKAKVFEDTDLHLRILRYEPIHFDMFLKCAAEGPTYPGRLKVKLRAFLDKQAINFYGAEPTGRRR